MTSSDFLTNLPKMGDEELDRMAAEVVMGWEFWLETRREYDAVQVMKDGRPPYGSRTYDAGRYRRITWNDVDPMEHLYRSMFSPTKCRNQSREVVEKAIGLFPDAWPLDRQIRAIHATWAVRKEGFPETWWITATPREETASAIYAILVYRESMDNVTK